MNLGPVASFLTHKGEVYKLPQSPSGRSAIAAMLRRPSILGISKSLSLVLLAMFVTPHQSHAQSNSPEMAQLASPDQKVSQGKRDPAAIDLIEKSLTALGGKASIATVQSIESTGTIADTGSGSTASFRWVVLISGSNFEFRRETNDGKTVRIFTSGHGHPGYMSGGTRAKRLGLQMATAAPPYELPASLLYAELGNAALSFTMVSSISKQTTHVQIKDESEKLIENMVTQDWYFDPQTNLPLRVEYNLPTSVNAAITIPASITFLSYKVFNNIQYPTSLESYENGAKVGQISIVSINENTAPDPSSIDIPLEAARSRGILQ